MGILVLQLNTIKALLNLVLAYSNTASGPTWSWVVQLQAWLNSESISACMFTN